MTQLLTLCALSLCGFAVGWPLAGPPGGMTGAILAYVAYEMVTRKEPTC